MTVRRSLRLAAAASVAVFAALLALLLLVHLPSMRGVVLRRALAIVERDFGVHVEADRLDYNIAALSVGLAGMRVSAPGTPTDPFVSADYVSAVLSPGALFGRLSITDLRGTDVRVTVRRRQDGTTNLPRSSGLPGDIDPPPLPVARIEIPRLAIDVRDEQAQRGLSLPGVSVLLTRDSGRISLTAAGELRSGTVVSRLSRLEGETSFDGRTLHLADVQIVADELSALATGSIGLLVREPRLDLRFRGTSDAAALSRWVLDEADRPRGELSFEGEASGPFNDVTSRISAAAQTLEWQRFTATALAARVEVTTAAADFSNVQLGLAGGRLSAAGNVTFGDGAVRMSASWESIDARTFMQAVVPDASFSASAAVDGRLEARGSGADPAGWSVDAHLDLAPRAASRGAIPLGGTVDVVLDDGAWQLDARQMVANVMPAALALRGRTVDGNPADMGVSGSLTIDRTNLPAVMDALRSVGLANVGDGIVRGGALEATFSIAGSVGRPSIDGDLALHDLRAPDVDVPSARIAVGGDPVRPDLTFDLLAPSAVIAQQTTTDLTARGRLRRAGATTAARGGGGLWLELDQMDARGPGGAGLFTGSGAYEIESGRYRGALTAAAWPVTATEERPVSALLDFQLAGEGTIEQLSAAGSASLADTRVRNVDVGPVDATVALDGRTAFVSAIAERFSAAVDARIGLDAPYMSTVDARTTNIDLRRVLRDFEIALPVEVEGTSTATMRAKGPLEDWRRAEAVLDVSTLDVTSRGLSMRLEEAARLAYSAGQVDVQRFEASVAGVRMSVFGALPVFDPVPDSQGLVVTATGTLEDIARAAAAAGVTRSSVVQGSGPAALLARVTGTATAPMVSADLDVGPGTVNFENLLSLEDVRLRVHAADGWVELQDGSASYQDATIAATGRAPVALLTGTGDPGGRATVRARAVNVTPEVLAAFVGPETIQQLSGSLEMTLEASSQTLDIADVTGELRFDRFDVRIADLPVTQKAPTRIVAGGGVVRVETWDWAGQGATIEVRGEVRLREREVAIDAGGTVDLRVLTPFVRDAGMTTAGRFTPRLKITGSLDGPLVEGDVTVDGGEIRLLDPRVLVSDLNLRAILGRTSAHIVSLTGTVNGGTLTGSGALEYADGGLTSQLSADVRSMALEAPQGLRSEIDASLNLASQVPVGNETLEMASRLSGTVTVRRGTYREPLALLTGLAAAAGARRVQTAGEAPSPFFDTMSLDVRLVTDEDLIVDNNYGRLNVGVDVRVGGTASAPAMAGRADVREGGRLFVGRNTFTVREGAIDFVSPVAIEPRLNVEAVTRAGGEEIVAILTGPADSPTVDLQSPTNPELGQADLTSILLTGRPFDELAPGDAAFVSAQIVGNLSAEVLGFAGRAFGLDALRLGGAETSAVRTESAAVATDVDPTTRLTFSKNIGADVEFTYSQSLRDGDAQTLVVQYDPAQRAEVRVVSDDDDLRSYGFRHDVEFGARSAGGSVRNSVAGTTSSPRVTRVDLSGDLGIDERQVRGVIRLEPGDRFDYVEWQDDRDRIEALYRASGRFTARVTGRRIEDPGGVVLAFDIAAGPATRIEFIGIDADPALRSRIETFWSQSVFDEFLFDEVRAAVRDVLARRGYVQPAIDVRMERGAGAEALIVAVMPGPATGRTVVRIDGAPGDIVRAATERLDERGLVDTAITNPSAVAADVLDYLRSTGYLQARVVAQEPLIEGDTAVLPLTVSPGPRLVLGRVILQGARTLPEQLVLQTAALTPGVPYDPAAVDAAADRLRVLYRGEGLTSAVMTARAEVREDAGAVDVTFDVSEGARQMLAEVVVSGNRSIATETVLRATGLSIGEPLTASSLIDGRTRLAETGLFRRLDVTPEPLETGATPAEAPVRVRVTVDEWPALRLRYGFVVAEERPEGEVEGRTLVPGVSADLVRRSLFGRAVTVGGAFDLQRREQRGRAFVSSPTLAGLPIGFSVVAERSREEFQSATLVTDRSRVSWEQRIRVNPRARLSYAYTFERNHTWDTAPLPGSSPVFDLVINIARLNAAGAFDTRNDPTDPLRGFLASTSLDYAPEALGSDIRFVRELVQAYYFRPWREAVFASAVRGGIVVPLGGQDLIPSERFYAGGSRTVRGLPEEGLGPRDFFGTAAGGEAMLVLNQEVRVPVYRWLRAVGFIDAGNVFPRPSDFSVTDLVGSGGFGLRLATPYAMLRVDFGRTMWGAAPALSGSRWTFGLGHAF